MQPAGTTELRGHIAFGPDSKEAIEQALQASSDLGHDWVGTEHTLLGLIRTEDSPAAQILRNLGFTSETCTTRSRPGPLRSTYPRQMVGFGSASGASISQWIRGGLPWNEHRPAAGD